MDRWADDKRGLYLAVLEEMDRQFGKLFDHIREDAALRDNTLILVCSDNGPEPGAGSAGGLRGAKTTLFEGGIRSPLVAWGPGIIAPERAGARDATSVFAAFDLVPSLLAIAGAKRPAGVAFDGEDISATLLGRAAASRQAPIHWRRPPDRKSWRPMIPETLPDLAVRDGSWKFLCDYDGSRPQLYNLAADPAESQNLAANHQDIVARLTAAALAWHQLMPPDNGPALGAEPQPPPGKQKKKAKK